MNKLTLLATVASFAIASAAFADNTVNGLGSITDNSVANNSSASITGNTVSGGAGGAGGLGGNATATGITGGNFGGNSNATGGSVLASGNSSNQNTNTSNNANTNTNNTNNANLQGQLQGQQQGQQQSNSSANSNSADNNGNAQNVNVVTNNPKQHRIVSGAASVFLTSGIDTCAGSAGGSISTGVVGGAFSSTTIDENCERRKDAQYYWNTGRLAAADARMCQNKDNRQALHDAGLLCPDEDPAYAPKRAALPAKVKAEMAKTKVESTPVFPTMSAAEKRAEADRLYWASRN